MYDWWNASSDGRLQRVVAIGNGKGGVGKTTIAANMAGQMGASGYKILLIDMDPQGSTRGDLGLRGSGIDDDGEALATSLQTGVDLKPATDVRPGVDLVVGGAALEDVPTVLAGRVLRGRKANGALATPLLSYLERSDARYDLVVIDTPPGDITLQRAALEAARWLLIPTQADTESLEGMAKIARQVNEVRSNGSPLELLGVVLFDELTSARRLRREVSADIEGMLGDDSYLFSTVIRTSTAGKDARRAGQLVHEYSAAFGDEKFWMALREGRSPAKPGSAPNLARDLFELTHEVLLRINEVESAAVGA